MGSKVAFDAPRWVIDFSITFILAVFILIVVLVFVNEKLNTNSIEADNVMKNVLYSDNCLTYNDGFNSYSGIIDINKMSKDRFKSCFSKDNLGYIVQLYDLDGNIIRDINPEFNLNVFIPICEGNKDFICSKKQEFVIYVEDNQKFNGILSMVVISHV